MERQVASRWMLPALGGAILGTSYYVPVLVPNLVAFLPMLYWLDRHAGEGVAARLRAGFAFGFAGALIGLHFCFPMLEISWLAGVLYVGFALALALRIAAVLAFAGWLRERTGWSWAVVLPAPWVAVDWLQTFGDLRMTGDHMAHAMAAYPFLIQFADLVGHYGVEIVVLAFQGLLYEALVLGRRRQALAAAVLAASVLGYDAWAWTRERPASGTTRVALVQPAIPLELKHGDDVRIQTDRLLELSRRAGAEHPDLIVWPESARPLPLLHWLDRPETYAMPEVSALARELHAAVLAGVEYARIRARDDYDLYNAAVLVEPSGRLDPTWAAKVYLVPFAEATPFRWLVGPLVDGLEGDWRWLAGGFRPGPHEVVLDVDGGRVGVLVCYEQLFPDLAHGLRRAGADFQVVITNDAWYGRTPFQYYLANVPRLRAIENRSAFVRVANTGISEFVDRRGVVHDRTALFEEAVAVADVEHAGPPTVYDRIGDVAVAACWLALAAAWGLALASSHRRRDPRA